MPSGDHVAQNSCPIPTPHAASVAETINGLSTDEAQGLDVREAARRLDQVGPNQLQQKPPEPRWKLLASQFRDAIVLLLIAAAVIAGVMGEWVDTLAIVAIVLLNGILGFLQEDRASRLLAALQSLSAPVARVVRSGRLQAIPARDLVPGDRIALEAGDNVPADARLIRAFALRVQEAALTGESTPVDKDAQVVLEPETPLGDRANLVFMGTVVASGKADAVVVATGMGTELGKIAGLLERTEHEPTPLQRRLAELGRVLLILCLVIVAIIFVLQWARGLPLWDAFLLSVSLAVAAVPEGLPAVVTMALALGLQRMVRRHTLVRKLPSVETLGSVTVICTDKTGTLTRNEMTVREIIAGGRSYQVTGAGYRPEGQFLNSDDGQPVEPDRHPDLERILLIGALCNNAAVRPARSQDGPDSWEVIGDPTEAALLVAALKGGINHAELDRDVLLEIPFDSERKAMSVVLKHDRIPRTAVAYTKGAPEVVLRRCTTEHFGGTIRPLSPERRDEITRLNAELASRALRVLALADRELPDHDGATFDERELVFAGLVGMIDPPRDEARPAVQTCRAAGIRPVMITGDHPATARAIGIELGLVAPGDEILTGRELDTLPDDALAADVHRYSVYARVVAEHKLRIVRAWKAVGAVVAMTGDGVNDAPAVRAADIGIAMGRTGTDVTKEAAGMVLTDDNFASIVSAVEEGRGIFDNIRKFIDYLLSCNAGEVLAMLAAALLGWPSPLTAIQILWINLVTDGLPALALGVEPPEPDIMKRKPRPPREPVITRQGGLRILTNGLLIALVSLAAFLIIRERHDIEHARTAAFCTMAFAQLFFAFVCRSQRYTLPQLGIRSNLYLVGAIAASGLLQLATVTIPQARHVFNTTTLPSHEWGWILLLALGPATVIELVKIARAAVLARRT